MIITIFAAIGSYNLGDELILKNEIELLEKEYKGENIEFIVFTYDKEGTFLKKDNVKYIDYFPKGIKDTNNFILNLKAFKDLVYYVYKTDLIIVGGGGIFFDKEVTGVSNPLKLWYFRSILFRFFNKKVLYNAIGIDIHNEKNLFLLKKIFSGNIRVKVRDINSFNILKKIGVYSEVVLDPVFFENSNIRNIQDVLIGKINKNNSLLEDLEGIFDINELKGKTFGLALRQGYINNEKENISELIEGLLSKEIKIILLPHSFHKENLFSNDYNFLKYFSDKYNLEICKSMLDTYNIYRSKKIDYCIGMRLHSMILSTVYSIKLIALSYSKKTDLLLKIGLNN